MTHTARATPAVNRRLAGLHRAGLTINSGNRRKEPLMSALYATINDCAAKNKPTGRGHRSIAATVKDWDFKIETTLEAAPKGVEVDTWATITVTDLHSGESVEIASDELRRIFKQAKARKEKHEREEAAISKLLLNRDTAVFALDAVR